MSPKNRASQRLFAAAEARADLSSPTILVAVESTPEPDAQSAPAVEPVALSENPDAAVGVPAAVQPPAETPDRFGQYKLLWETGRDALSITYACEREGVSSPLAIRVFNRRFTDEVQIRQIQRAAKTAADLTHANIVVVYENGVDESGAPYVVSDWVEGESLSDVLAVDKRLDIARFLNIFQQVCDGLIEAHSRQLLHRNLSPDKILLLQDSNGHESVKMKDFGMPPDPVKNAFYLSTEQCVDANKIDARADIYSLGCIMYEVLVGSPPFVGYGAKQASLDFLHDLANRYSPQSSEHKALKLLDCIIAKCLQRKPAKRFGNARELSSALQMVQDCLVNGSNKRLPSKAEKLLLFRFLDMFDRKIVACAFAYMCLGMICVKYLGEIQLQKDIDAAQLAMMSNDEDRAQERWKAALNQAYLLGKPASLKAELHWQAAEGYGSRLWHKRGHDSDSELARDAIDHYSQALTYYGKGAHHQSNAITLCQQMANLWYQVDPPGKSLQDVHIVITEADKLYNQKRFAECAKICTKHLEHEANETLANLAACSYNELALKSHSAKRIRLFERAQHYMNMTVDGWRDRSISNNLAECYYFQGEQFITAEMHQEQACKAILEGDYLAAMGELHSHGYAGYELLRDSLSSYLRFEQDNKVPQISKESAKRALVELERLLKLQKVAFGKHSEKLAHTYCQLAQCYRVVGADELQSEALKNYFAVADRNYQWSAFRCNALLYADLLEKQGHRGQAIQFLSKTAERPLTFDSDDNALHLKLIGLYVRNKQPALANTVLDQLIDHK